MYISLVQFHPGTIEYAMYTTLQVPMFVVGSKATRSINRDVDLRGRVDSGEEMKRGAREQGKHERR